MREHGTCHESGRHESGFQRSPEIDAFAAFSPDGARLVTASDDHTARVWDARSGKPLTAPL